MNAFWFYAPCAVLLTFTLSALVGVVWVLTVVARGIWRWLR